ncbi:DUF4263 domain-containing protein [Micromonospora yasonensis]|uniref:DUF4263 domain-containing protein n=1 Tax=Micromonospora yasonensis TaxID=1128667 RepID=UPI00222EEB00|nr:DUF4263 domain-containing protein [Micromonospora yasonensis]MCW3840996.1 DUF4263 domain-containing protein [Micromonospora yasonensis]
MTETLHQLAALLQARDDLDVRIAALTGRSARPGDIGEFIAAQVFDIELAGTGIQAGYDGTFRSGPNAGRTKQRGNVIPNGQVHRAVGQVMNYLVALDEDRIRILDQHGIDVRRAAATVIIGHPDFQAGIQEEKINEALRTYGSHLARVEVITYKQLLDGATRALSLN